MKTILGTFLVPALTLFISTTFAEDNLVNMWILKATGNAINAIPEFSCNPTRGIHKGEVLGRVYIITYCQSGASYAVHFLPDETDLRVTDCNNLLASRASCDNL